MGSAAEASTVALGRTWDPLDQVDYRLAETPEEKEEIYNLRYRAYLREGAIRPSAEQRVVDQYEDAPNAWTFGVYFQGELYSSIRVSVLTAEWRMSPSVELFGDVLHPKLDKGLVFIDSTRFVADPDKARNFPELPYVTVRLGSVAGVHFNADFGLAIVRPEHQAFYRRVTDSVHMPEQTRFATAEEYYSTLFHELSHSTGHSTRLDRKVDTEPQPFGSSDYGKEELVAEMAAAFLCGEVGIKPAVIDNQAAYIGGWLKQLKSEKKLVIAAAGAAQKAADWIRGERDMSDRSLTMKS